MKVLIADHDPVEAERLRRIVKDAGDEALLARTGAQALASIAASPPDVLIHSTGLPDLAGVELLRQIRINPASREMCVILVADPSDAVHFARAHQYHSDFSISRSTRLQDFIRLLDRIRPWVAEFWRYEDSRFSMVSPEWDEEWKQFAAQTSDEFNRSSE